MKIKPYKEIKHTFMMNREDLSELNDFCKSYFGLDDIKEVHIWCPDTMLSGGYQADVTCLEISAVDDYYCKEINNEI